MVTTLSTEREQIHTAHFGRVEVRAEEIIEFVTPLPPFVERRFVLLGKAEEAPFKWLQSVDEPALALVVAPYEEVVGEAAPGAPKRVREELGLLTGEEAAVYVIVSLGAQPRETTMNVLAPVYVCAGTGRARQVIVGEDLGKARQLIANSE